jgi:hypothetical protein
MLPRSPMRKIIIPDSDDHLDTDALAALTEKALSKKDSPSIFAHLAACERCRDCLRVTTQLGEFHWTRAEAPQRTLAWLRPPNLFFRAAGIACAFAALWLVTSNYAIESRYKSPDVAAISPPLTAVSAIALRPVAYRTFTFVSEPSSPKRPFRLPGPLASARLNNNVSFVSISSHAPGNNQIAIKTSLGERWIALDIFDNRLIAPR